MVKKIMCILNDCFKILIIIMEKTIPAFPNITHVII